MKRQTKAPFAYYGGKQLLAPLIVSLIPPHECYVEVFGGAASVLWVKSPSRLEVYNDRDSGVVNFFRVLRDPRAAVRLREALRLTPYAREEYEECRATWRMAADEVEMARRWYVAIQQGFNNHLGDRHNGWSYDKRTYGGSPAGRFRAGAASLDAFTARLARVQIEHGDFSDILSRYDAPGTCFYLDPPYLPETRVVAAAYSHEMSYQDHERLLTDLVRVRGAVVLSGYDSDLYNGALTDWTRITISAPARGGKRVGSRRTECIWLSPSCQHAQPELWAGIEASA